MPNQKPVNIVTTLWGDWPHGENLGVEYVNRMARALERNLTIPYTFTALVDRFEETCCDTRRDGVKFLPGVYVSKLPLQGALWPGCLPKLSVHADGGVIRHKDGIRYWDVPDLMLGGESKRILLIDLDTIITGNIDHFAQYGGQLATRMAFREPGQSGGDLIAFENGGEMSRNLWRKITTDYDELIEMTQGRERFVYRSRDWTPQPEFWSDLFPGEYVSYKRHIRPHYNKLPENVKLVSCHGLNTNGPRPHHLLEQGIDWVKEHWS
jgi:hypothetical protein